jgi:excisionase family DNA binding protein
MRSHVTATASLPTFLTVDELAALLRCQPEKVYRLAARGELPSYKVEGRRLFNEAEVVRWLESCKARVGSERFSTR